MRNRLTSETAMNDMTGESHFPADFLAVYTAFKGDLTRGDLAVGKQWFSVWQAAQESTRSLTTNDGHERYIALVSSPGEVPRVAVGAFPPPDEPGPARALFMTSMDLETARSYAEAILATCRMAQVDLDESRATIRQ
jgi:hypothetical protein